MAERGDAIVENFIEQMGLSYEAQNQPRIAGRLLALMVLEGKPLSLADMAGRLDVSRASASTNARVLEASGVLERAVRQSDRSAVYRLAETPYAHLMENVVKRIGKIKALVDTTRSQVAREPEGAAERLGELSDFYGELLVALSSVGGGSKRED